MSEAIVLGATAPQVEQGLDHIFLLVDRSGSMASVWGTTVKSIKAFLSEQITLADRRIVVDICTFNHSTNNMEHIGIRPDQRFIDALDLPRPHGGTALLDAMGGSINYLLSRLRRQEKQPERVYFITATDGEENCSREWTQTLVKDRVEMATNRGWEFIYLGANQDAFKVAQNVGIAASNTSNYDTGKTEDAYKGVSSNILRSRSSGKAATFTDEDRKVIGSLGPGN